MLLDKSHAMGKYFRTALALIYLDAIGDTSFVYCAI